MPLRGDSPFLRRNQGTGTEANATNTSTSIDSYAPYGPPTQSKSDSLLINGMALAGIALALFGTWVECSTDPDWVGVHAWWNGNHAEPGTGKGTSKRSSRLERKRGHYRVGLRFLRWMSALTIFADFALYTRLTIPADEFDLSTIAGGFRCSHKPPFHRFGSIKCIRFKELDIISVFEGAGLGHSVGSLLQQFVKYSIRICVLQGWVLYGARAYTLFGWVSFALSIVEVVSFNASAALVYACVQWHLLAAAFMMRSGDHDADGFADSDAVAIEGSGEGQGVELVAVQGSSSAPIATGDSNVVKARAVRHSTVCDVDVV